MKTIEQIAAMTDKERNQQERILFELYTRARDGGLLGGLTPMDAWQNNGVYRLAAVVHSLKKNHGWKIRTDTAKVSNRFGEKCEVAAYVLVLP